MGFRTSFNIRYMIFFCSQLISELYADNIHIYYVVCDVIHDIVSLSMFLYRSVYY